MWTRIVLMSQIREVSRWKVEFFCNEIAPKANIAFDWVALEKIVDERKELLDPQSYPDHLFNYLGLENVQSVTGDLVGFGPRYGKEIRSKSKIFRQGDVLYGRLRPYLNKVFLADDQVPSGICSGEFLVLKPRINIVLPNFLRTALASNYVQQFVGNLQTGSALPRLQLNDLLKIEIPLPPIDVQERYEEFIIRENTRRRKLVTEVMRLPQALIEAFTHSLEEGVDPSISLGQLHENKWNIDNPLPIDFLEKVR